MTLGQRIQELRKQEGLSQEALGEALGVSRQAVSKWEADGGIPELDSLIAMSRLFGISIGSLLGVEESAPEAGEEEAVSAVEEERVVAILRRYVEESRLTKPTPAQWLKKWGWLPALGIVLAGLLGVLFARIGSLQSTVYDLQSSVVLVNTSVSNLSDSVGDTVLAIVDEKMNPIRAFEYQVTGFSLKPKRIKLRLDAALKSYTQGETEVQYLVKWVKGAESGEETSAWISGPDWTGSVTIPINEKTTVTVRIREGGEMYQEFEILEPLQGISLTDFALEIVDLKAPFAVTIEDRGGNRQITSSEYSNIWILSSYPDYIYPTGAYLTAWLNGEEFISNRTLTVTENTEWRGYFDAEMEHEHMEISMNEGDVLEIRLFVSNNWQHSREFRESWIVKNGQLWKQSIPAEEAE